ncbi:hypothetical protein [Rhizobium phage RHph_X2_26]|nr:hypothetical protein [Rhizobium phage RHph_X2_26]
MAKRKEQEPAPVYTGLAIDGPLKGQIITHGNRTKFIDVDTVYAYRGRMWYMHGTFDDAVDVHVTELRALLREAHAVLDSGQGLRERITAAIGKGFGPNDDY